MNRDIRAEILHVSEIKPNPTELEWATPLNS